MQVFFFFSSLLSLSAGLYADKPGGRGQIPCLLAGLVPEEKGHMEDGAATSLGIAKPSSRDWGIAGMWPKGKAVDITSSSHRMRSGALIIVGIQNHHFNIQIRTAKPLRMNFKVGLIPF